jgi:hypothetical protein
VVLQGGQSFGRVRATGKRNINLCKQSIRLSLPERYNKTFCISSSLKSRPEDRTLKKPYKDVILIPSSRDGAGISLPATFNLGRRSQHSQGTKVLGLEIQAADQAEVVGKMEDHTRSQRPGQSARD